MKTTLFVSSAQKELQAERRAIKEYVQSDPLLRRFFEVFLFEDLPARDRRPDHVYLAEVDRCGVYVCLVGHRRSAPTAREFDRATSKGKVRFLFVKGTDDTARHPVVRALMAKAGANLVWRQFEEPGDLVGLLKESLVEHLEGRGVIQDRPFDERPCTDASLDDLDAEAVAAFVRRARAERQFPLPERTQPREVLTHLHLLLEDRPSMGAILLFGRDPQRFVPAAEVRCMHFHGTTVQRPAPSYQVYKGTVFRQVDQAVDFVLSVLNRQIGTREIGPRAPVRYDVPPDVIHEAIVNAVAHRDYSSRGSVQVSVFADRVEVRNPGPLPSELTPEDLLRPHPSLPRNHRICEPLFLTRYIEKYGTGTLMMIHQCAGAGVPAPSFLPHGAEFIVTLWRDWLTPEVIAALGLNERQSRSLAVIKTLPRITIGEYMKMVQCPRRTAGHDLDALVARGVLRRAGKGRGAYYVLDQERARNVPNAPSPPARRTAAPRSRRIGGRLRKGDRE